MKLIDTHAHVNFAAYRDDIEEVLFRAHNSGVSVINVGTQYSTSKKSVELAHKYDFAWAAVGMHPVHLEKGSFLYTDSDELTPEEIKTVGEEFDYNKYLDLARDKRVVAIGEIGLDYHHFNEADDIEKQKKRQKEVFLEFIRMANAVNKPVIVHCWDGYTDLLELLISNPVERKGVIHSFNGGYKTARKFIELGYYIGMNGMITYGDGFHRLIKEIDIANIIIETDCPYLGPNKHKGSRNEPLFVCEVAQKIADVKEISLQEVADTTTMNAENLFGIKVG